jgi:2-polyprenyl-3-methyl-5-hydroxy-6-metoxy-1,4-benzoquinol methylase
VLLLLLCPSCKKPLSEENQIFICSYCGIIYQQNEGIFQFNNNSPQNEKYFPDSAFEDLNRSEEQNFWFRVRNIIIGNSITRYLPRQSRILDVGCGTGYVSRYMKKLGYHVVCTDFFLQALQFCKEREAGERYYQNNLSDQLFIEEFNGVCAFDVLEHIEDDYHVMKNLYAALKPGGILILTVPADKRIWSIMDVYAEHKRRYSAKELRAKLERNGFRVIKLSYFMTFLYPVIVLSRKFSIKSGKLETEQEVNRIKFKLMNELQPNWIVNSILFFIFRLEVPFIGLFDLPFGSSLLCIAVKES